MLCWPKRFKLARAFRWEYSCKRLQLAQLLGQLGVFLTFVRRSAASRVQTSVQVLHGPRWLWPSDLGSGRAVASETEAPNMLVNPV